MELHFAKPEVLTESFLPTQLSLGGLDDAARDEVLRLFPELSIVPSVIPAVRPMLRMADAGLVADHHIVARARSAHVAS